MGGEPGNRGRKRSAPAQAKSARPLDERCPVAGFGNCGASDIYSGRDSPLRAVAIAGPTRQSEHLSFLGFGELRRARRSLPARRCRNSLFPSDCVESGAIATEPYRSTSPIRAIFPDTAWANKRSTVSVTPTLTNRLCSRRKHLMDDLNMSRNVRSSKFASTRILAFFLDNRAR